MQEPLLKIGIISDIQGAPYPEDWGSYNMEAAFALLAEKKVDMIINGGDTVDHPYDGVYELYWHKMNEYFGGQLPLHVVCEGNHDCFGSTPENYTAALNHVFDMLRRDHSNPWHQVIEGYDFLSIATSDKAHYQDQAALEALRAELEKAVARDNQKPIFVITHFPPKNTMSGSFGGSGSQELFDVLKDFPQVVSFSGHTHYPMRDERTIWQGEFTAIETSTLSYGCIGGEAFNVAGGCILPFAREVNEILYMEVFSDKLVIERWNVQDKLEIAPEYRWNIPLPFCAETAPYTREKRLPARTAPEFPQGAKILTRYDFGYYYIAFKSAVSGDFAQFYDIEITVQNDDGSWCDPQEFRYVSDFYRWKKNQADLQFFKMPDTALKPGKVHRFRVFPVESFGKRGTPLELVFTISKHTRLTPLGEQYPQE